MCIVRRESVCWRLVSIVGGSSASAAEKASVCWVGNMAGRIECCTNVELHGVVRFLHAEGLKPIEIHRWILVTYGENCMSWSQVYERVEKFRNGIT